MDDKFKYTQWTNEAFMLIFKNVLSTLSTVRDRAIYITFATKHMDVILPDNIKKQYPNKITIVLENEFWNLSVSDNFFTVTLVFDDKQSDISVPFHSIVSFSDKKAHVCFEFHQEPEDKNIISLDEYRT